MDEAKARARAREAKRAKRAAEEREKRQKMMRRVAAIAVSVILMLATAIAVAKCAAMPAGHSGNDVALIAAEQQTPNGRAILAIDARDGGYVFSVADEDGIEEIVADAGQVEFKYDCGANRIYESQDEAAGAAYVVELTNGMAMQIAESLSSVG